MSMLSSILFAAAGLSGQPVTAPSCPLTLPSASIRIAAPEGWSGYTPGPLRLFAFGMMDGPPATMTYLVPTKSIEKDKGGSDTWLVTGAEIWLHCNYGGTDAIQISRVIARNVASCTVDYTQSGKGGRITGMAVSCVPKPR